VKGWGARNQKVNIVILFQFTRLFLIVIGKKKVKARGGNGMLSKDYAIQSKLHGFNIWLSSLKSSCNKIEEVRLDKGKRRYTRLSQKVSCVVVRTWGVGMNEGMGWKGSFLSTSQMLLHNNKWWLIFLVFFDVYFSTY